MGDKSSRIPGFYKYPRPERLRLLLERGFLSEEDFHTLMDGRQVLSADRADQLIENVVGVLGLPLGLGLNFIVNDKPYIVPIAVEEPSITAALSAAAKLVASAGGFVASSDPPLLMGQVQVVGVPHPVRAKAKLLQREDQILDLANAAQPRMVWRGGGARELEVRLLPGQHGRSDMLVLDLFVDTCDAMGANVVNAMCETVSPLVEEITGGQVFLRILSNLADRALARAEARIPAALLATPKLSGAQVRDGIVLASDFAVMDPYRAATHNKGIMNGVDGVALATGNDWRAIEAAAHAYAGRGPSYTALATWSADPSGDLVGRIELPMKVGTVGGQIRSNPAVQVALRLLDVSSAQELAQVIAAVGLAQNFGALRALTTEGIQRGHMGLHARSCAAAAGAPPRVFEEVVRRLTESGEIKVWKAQQIVAELSEEDEVPRDPTEEVPEAPGGTASAKVTLLGEHAVLYGRHAIAAALPLAVRVEVRDASESGVSLAIPRWRIQERLSPTPQTAVQRCLALILEELGVQGRDLSFHVWPHVSRAMGLGASASLSVALIRALVAHAELDVSDARVNEIAYACESITHGTASGIDNTLATYGKFVLYRQGDPPVRRRLEVPKPLPVVLGLTSRPCLTARCVGTVQRAWEANTARYEEIFDQMEVLTLEGADAIEAYDLPRLGTLMNICHGLLNALQVSTWELEELVGIARKAGACGAKLTGAGGGGAMVALCPDDEGVVQARIAAEMRKAGYRAITAGLA